LILIILLHQAALKILVILNLIELTSSHAALIIKVDTIRLVLLKSLSRI
jgi:hypothetical protein